MTTIAWGQHISNTQKLGEPVPAGQYPAVCEEAVFTSSKAGDPQWKMRWRIIGGPHNNRTVLDQQTLATGADEKAPIRRGFFFQAMEQLGMPSEFFIQADPPGELVAQRLQGVNALLDLTINDRNFNNVRRYTMTGGAQPQEQQAQPQGFNPAAQQQPMPQAQPQMQPQGGFQQQPAQQGFGQMPQPQPAQQGFAPAAQPAPQPQYPQNMPQPPPGYVDPSQQGGFQPAQQPAQGFQQAGGAPMAPMQAGMPQAPQGGYVPEQAGQPQVGPDGQPLAPVDQNGQQGPQVNFTPQPRPPF